MIPSDDNYKPIFKEDENNFYEQYSQDDSAMKQFYKNNKKVCNIVISIAVIILFIIYFIFYYQKGIIYHNSFLKLKFTTTEQVFSNNLIKITVNKLDGTSAEITYQYGDNQPKTHIVELGEEIEHYSQRVKIKDDKNNVLFNGTAQITNDYCLLFNEKGELFADSIFKGSVNEGVYPKEHEMNYSYMIKLADSNLVQKRGNFGFLFLALCFIALTIIDIKFPLFYFKLNTMWWTQNAEPTDYYYFMQNVSRVIISIVALILLMMSLFMH